MSVIFKPVSFSSPQDGKCISDWIWNCDNTNDDNRVGVWIKSRNEIKVGKFVNKITEGKYQANKIEEFVNSFKSIFDDFRKKITIVSGDDIGYWYDSNNYYSQWDGTLGSSCMRTMNKGVFNVYIKNPESCRMVIMTSDNKLVARAILWKLNSISGKYDEGDFPKVEYFMDRVYSSEDYLVNKMNNLAIEKGWAYKNHKDLHNRYSVIYNNEEYNVNMDVKIKRLKYGNYPYTDTFKRYDFERGIIYNDGSSDKRGLLLDSTGGLYTKNKLGIFKKIKNLITNS